MVRASFICAAFIFLFFSLPGLSQASEKIIPGRVIVHFSDNAATPKSLDRKTISFNKSLDLSVVRVPRGQEKAFIKIYKNKPGVDFVEKDTLAYALTADPGWPRQWGLDNSFSTIQPDKIFAIDSDIDAPEAWPLISPIISRVAVLDTGIDQDHSDLSGKIVAQRNFSASTTLDDRYGHGTHVAGIIAAIPNNSIGVAGVAPNATLLNGKVLGDNGSGSCSSVANGITWAADQGAKVISMSLGGSGCSAQSSAVQYAWNKGALVVAAAGNSATSSPSYPAAYKPALAVAATDNSDLLASFSNFGSWVEIAAPGENIYSTMTNHKSTLSRSVSYGYLSGTSMATPIVSGAAAFMSPIDLNGNGRVNDEIRDRLVSTADRPSSVINKIAGGRLNLCRAVQATC